ncbi:hypothetical protein IW262DRAFT_144651 [Armillaria fumosa]|nr:hypothetical protein IW262DRAFT_144651 [Armillaria fumosa]
MVTIRAQLLRLQLPLLLTLIYCDMSTILSEHSLHRDNHQDCHAVLLSTNNESPNRGRISWHQYAPRCCHGAARGREGDAHEGLLRADTSMYKTKGNTAGMSDGASAC